MENTEKCTTCGRGDASNGQVCEDEIAQFVDSLPPEAIRAGRDAVESEVIGDYITCLGGDLKTVIRAILFACRKAGRTDHQLPAWRSVSGLDGSPDIRS